MVIDDIEAAALKLSPQARARLANSLLASLDDLNSEELDQIWSEEALLRNNQWDAGELEVRSADEILRDVRSRL